MLRFLILLMIVIPTKASAAGVAPVYGLFEIDVLLEGILTNGKLNESIHIKSLHTLIGFVTFLLDEEAAASNFPLFLNRYHVQKHRTYYH